jgi:hypothetical protein
MAAICVWRGGVGRGRGRLCICIQSCKCGKRKWVFHYIMSDIFNGQVSGDNIEKVCFKTFTIKVVNPRVPKD